MTHAPHRFAQISGPLAALLPACMACAAPLFNNATSSASVPALNASTISLSGVAAPAGAKFSEVQSLGSTECNMIGGLAAQSTEFAGTYRFADNFTVPFPGWRLSGLTLYAYQPGAIGPTSPFAAVNLRIWSGAPGAPGSGVVFGDTQTNRLVNATSTGTYRIFNSVVAPFPAVPDTTRLIWQLDTSCATYLPAGNYWVDFQIEPIDPSLHAFVPTATIAQVRTLPGFNAMQYRTSTLHRSGAWEPILDLGKPAEAADVPQDLPFIVFGVEGCSADFNLDMAVDMFDYLDFVQAFVGQTAAADINHDSVIDMFDYLDFVSTFAAGC